ncbi:hypothetical protein AB0G64_37830, partial [Streptomyces longwoodensis]
MRTRPIMLIAATATAIATAAGVASAATGTPQPTATAHVKPSGNRVTATPAGFTVTSTRTSPIGAGAVAKILASCLGPDASN